MVRLPIVNVGVVEAQVAIIAIQAIACIAERVRVQVVVTAGIVVRMDVIVQVIVSVRVAEPQASIIVLAIANIDVM